MGYLMIDGLDVRVVCAIISIPVAALLGRVFFELAIFLETFLLAIRARERGSKNKVYADSLAHFSPSALVASAQQAKTCKFREITRNSTRAQGVGSCHVAVLRYEYKRFLFDPPGKYQLHAFARAASVRASATARATEPQSRQAESG
jgi:hypothetical protein